MAAAYGAHPDELDVAALYALSRLALAERVSHHYPHAMDYLLYAHLQRAEDAPARAVLDETLGRGPFQDSFISAFHLAVMPARFAVERRAWPEAAGI